MVMESIKVGDMVLFQIKEALEKNIIGKGISMAKIWEETSWHILETTQRLQSGEKDDKTKMGIYMRNDSGQTGLWQEDGDRWINSRSLGQRVGGDKINGLGRRSGWIW